MPRACGQRTIERIQCGDEPETLYSARTKRPNADSYVCLPHLVKRRLHLAEDAGRCSDKRYQADCCGQKT